MLGFAAERFAPVATCAPGVTSLGLKTVDGGKHVPRRSLVGAHKTVAHGRTVRRGLHAAVLQQSFMAQGGGRTVGQAADSISVYHIVSFYQRRSMLLNKLEWAELIGTVPKRENRPLENRSIQHGIRSRML